MSDFDPLDTAAIEREAEDRKAEAEREEATEESDLKWLMNDPRGRRIVRRWLSQAGVFRLSFTGDAQATAFNEGQRNTGLRLFSQITRWTPERIAELMREEDDERRDRDD